MAILVAVLFVLIVLDIHTTKKIQKQGGRELNPVVAWFQEGLGDYLGLVIPKFAGLYAFTIAIFTMPRAVAWIILIIFCLLHLWVVYHNKGEIR